MWNLETLQQLADNFYEKKQLVLKHLICGTHTRRTYLVLTDESESKTGISSDLFTPAWAIHGLPENYFIFVFKNDRVFGVDLTPSPYAIGEINLFGLYNHLPRYPTIGD